MNKTPILRLCMLIVAGLFIFQDTWSATFTVTSTADAGANTLRQAIINANSSAGADIINFNFGTPVTITLSSCLPAFTQPVMIDGYSDPGASAGNLMIEVISPAGCNDFDFGPGSDGSTIQGLVISGGTNGVYLRNSNGHTVKGNYIGTNRAGTAMAAARPQNCIHVNTSNNNVIGGTGGQIDRNILSGATQDGIRMQISTGNTVINNYIGVSASGNTAIGNGSHGIEAYNNSHNLRVGGTTFAERNVISSNAGSGLYTTNCMSPVVKGNIFGMGANGTTMLGNAQSGVEILNTGAGATQIGGTTLAERNYSSCNGAFGVVVRFANDAVIEGNWLGVDMTTGNLDYGNHDAAITVTNSADVRVGGSVAGSGNICSASGNPGFGADGISIWSSSPRPVVKGNIIGLGADGVTSLQNYGHGIECLTCDDGIIGGTTLTERNLIASSYYIGIQLVNSPRVVIYNNYIGTDVSGTLNRGSTQMGIHVDNSNSVIIGGSAAHSNIIAYNNASAGIVVENNSDFVSITYNSIFCNTGPGIDLAGASANEGVPTPGITSSTANSVSGTGVNGNIVHVYLNNTGDGGVKCDCEGEVYIGTALVSGGVWTVIHNLGLSAASAGTVTAMQTTPLLSTSEFSTCTPPLPMELLYFTAEKSGIHSVHFSWATAMEKNNKSFDVQYSTDGIHFKTISTVQGNGNSNDIKYYSVFDDHIQEGINYYRLQQTDYDGQQSTSEIKSIISSEDKLSLLPEQNGFSVITSKDAIEYEVYSLTGNKILSGKMNSAHYFSVLLELPAAVYIVSVSDGDGIVRGKIVVE